jgi:hypothetical protein
VGAAVFFPSGLKRLTEADREMLIERLRELGVDD